MFGEDIISNTHRHNHYTNKWIVNCYHCNSFKLSKWLRHLLVCSDTPDSITAGNPNLKMRSSHIEKEKDGFTWNGSRYQVRIPVTSPFLECPSSGSVTAYIPKT